MVLKFDGSVQDHHRLCRIENFSLADFDIDDLLIVQTTCIFMNVQMSQRVSNYDNLCTQRPVPYMHTHPHSLFVFLYTYMYVSKK
jgi:hypothetical protein